ncbi:prolyl oligopeptidase, partial [Aphelenchoides avenae]
MHVLSRRIAPTLARNCLQASAAQRFSRISAPRRLLASALLHEEEMTDATKGVFNVDIDPGKYPQARRDDAVVDDFHGTKVPDPYRWLEDPDSEETKAFVQKLNEISKPFLKASDVRDKMRDRLTKLWDYEKYGCTARHGEFYYYYYNSGLQNQSVLYQQKSLDEKGTVFMDPNKLSDDGTTFIRQSSWTDDGTMLAYGVSEKGSDWVTVKFKKNTGEDLPDEIKNVKFSAIDWIHTNEGVFYSKYPDHTGKAEGTEVKRHEYHSLFYHKLGTPYTEDVLVAEFRDNPSFMCSGGVTEDGRYLVVDVNKGCDPTNQLYYFDLQSVDHKVTGKLPLKPLFDKFDAKYDMIDNDGDSALVLTNHESPMFKLIRVNMATANEGPSKWETVIAEDERRKLDWVAPIAGDKMVVAYVEDVK